MSKTTLVLGASSNPNRFAYLAIKSLKNNGHNVVAIGKRREEAHGVTITNEAPTGIDIHTVSLYLNAKNQSSYTNYIISLNPRRIIFNPGSENPQLLSLARENGVEIVFGCTLVMLSSGTY